MARSRDVTLQERALRHIGRYRLTTREQLQKALAAEVEGLGEHAAKNALTALKKKGAVELIDDKARGYAPHYVLSSSGSQSLGIPHRELRAAWLWNACAASFLAYGESESPQRCLLTLEELASEALVQSLGLQQPSRGWLMVEKDGESFRLLDIQGVSPQTELASILDTHSNHVGWLSKTERGRCWQRSNLRYELVCWTEQQAAQVRRRLSESGSMGEALTRVTVGSGFPLVSRRAA